MLGKRRWAYVNCQGVVWGNIQRLPGKKNRFGQVKKVGNCENVVNELWLRPSSLFCCCVTTCDHIFPFLSVMTLSDFFLGTMPLHYCSESK